MADRKPGEQLNPEERAELAFEAYELAVKRHTHREIARAIGVHHNTVGGLLREERARRRAEQVNKIGDSIATYQTIIRRALETYDELANNRNLTSQNRVASLNAGTSAQARIDMVLGLEAPKKSDITQRIEKLDLSLLTDAQLEQIEKLVRLAEVQAPSEN